MMWNVDFKDISGNAGGQLDFVVITFCRNVRQRSDTVYRAIINIFQHFCFSRFKIHMRDG